MTDFKKEQILNMARHIENGRRVADGPKISTLSHSVWDQDWKPSPHVYDDAQAAYEGSVLPLMEEVIEVLELLIEDMRYIPIGEGVSPATDVVFTHKFGRLVKVNEYKAQKLLQKLKQEETL